jgi:sulfite exporter TauE/SafE
MHKAALANTGEAVMLTVGLSILAALTLASIAVAIDSAHRRRRRRAICASVMVGVLTLGGLVAAIYSSVA